MTRQEAINWIINISADIGKAEHRDLWHYEQALYEIREMLESAEPEIKPISFQDCSNAMLKMWMDNIVTDGEYNRIMDKLIAHEKQNGGKNERFDKP